MAKVNTIKVCKRCQAEVSVEDVACRACGLQLIKPPSRFATPDYISLQRLDIPDTSLEAGKTVAEKLSFSASLDKEMHTWIRTLTTEERLAALQDAKLILQNLIHSTADRANLRVIVDLGKDIGKLSESLDMYFRAGGVTYDSEAGPLRTEPRDDFGGERTTP